MPNVRFNLKSEAPPQLIILVFRYQGKKFQYSTGEKVDPRFWDKTKCRAKRVREFPGHKSLNKLLDKLERATEDAYRECLADDECDDINEAMREKLDMVMRRGAGQIGLIGFIEQLVDERRNSPEYSERTIKGYVTCLNKLKDFEEHRRKPITFDSIDLDFSLDLREWMFSQGHKANYVRKIQQTVQAFMNEANERELTDNTRHRSRRFKVQAEEVQNIYLNTSELAELYHLELEPRLERVRDLFIVGCFTGLRFSDFSRISAEHIDGDMIRIRAKKTGKVVHVPIHPFVRAILEKHGGLVPGGISGQKFNQYIKEACRMTSWGEEGIMLTKASSRGRYEVRTVKSAMVASHTARRSFCTNAYLAGMQPIDIMQVSGHRTEKAFLKYIKVSGEQKARIIGRHEFFNQSVFKTG